MTPYEAYHHIKPNIAHLRAFGCKAFVHIPAAKRTKFGAKSLECVHLGYSENKKAYILLHRPTNRIIESRDVFFDEGATSGQSRVVIDPTDAPDDVEGEDEAQVSEDPEDDDMPNFPPTSDDESDDANGSAGLGTTQGTQNSHSVGAGTAGSQANEPTSQSGGNSRSDGSSSTTRKRSANRTSDSDSSTSKTATARLRQEIAIRWRAGVVTAQLLLLPQNSADRRARAKLRSLTTTNATP